MWLLMRLWNENGNQSSIVRYAAIASKWYGIVYQLKVKTKLSLWESIYPNRIWLFDADNAIQ